MKVTFHTKNIPSNTYVLRGARYSNNRLALQLYGTNGEPWAMLTINVPETKLEPNEIIIKNYSENEGCYDELIRLGIIHEAHKYIHLGYVTAPVARLTDLGMQIQDGTPLMPAVNHERWVKK